MYLLGLHTNSVHKLVDSLPLQRNLLPSNLWYKTKTLVAAYQATRPTAKKVLYVLN